jgi:ketosteroid isomerase-like protein
VPVKSGKEKRKSKDGEKSNDGKHKLAFAAIVISFGSLITSVISLAITCELMPLKETPIINIIKTETEAVLTGDFDRIMKYYSDNACVQDVQGELRKKYDCTFTEQTTWTGKNEIRNRYADLPGFTSLNHTGIIVTFSVNKNFANATASTNGVIMTDSGKKQDIYNIDGERWTFECIDGKWKITSFKYNIP